MNQKELLAFAKETAKSMKTEKVTVEAALGRLFVTNQPETSKRCALYVGEAGGLSSPFGAN